MNSFVRAAFAVCLLSASATLVGCGDEGPFKLHPVKGKVTLEDGSKLPGDNRRIIFYPKGSEPRSPGALIADDGTYAIETLEPADGAPEGEYTVVIRCTNNADYAAGNLKQLVNAKFTDQKTSPLSVKVPGGVYDFKVAK